MARGINKVILIGNLGDDVKLRRTEGGTAVTTISIATSDVWVDKVTNEQKENTEWHDVVLWRNLAENADKYLKKGSKVYVEGQLQTRKWEDKEGHSRKTTEIIARDLQFLDKKEVNERDSSLSEEGKSTRIKPRHKCCRDNLCPLNTEVVPLPCWFVRARHPDGKLVKSASTVCLRTCVVLVTTDLGLDSPLGKPSLHLQEVHVRPVSGECADHVSKRKPSIPGWVGEFQF